MSGTPLVTPLFGAWFSRASLRATLLVAAFLIVAAPSTFGQVVSPANSPPTEMWRIEPEVEWALSLQDALRLALANSFQVESARLDRSIAARAQEIEASIFDPVLSASSDYADNRRPTVSTLDIGAPALAGSVVVNPFEIFESQVALSGRTLFGGEYALSARHAELDQPLANSVIFGLNPQDFLSVTAEIRQPLLRGAGREYATSGVRAAEARLAAADRGLAAAINDGLFAVERAYWRLSFAQRDLEAREAAYQAALAVSDREDARQRLGAGASGERLIAESQRLLRLTERDDALVRVYDARDELLLLLNRGGLLGGSERRAPPLEHVWIETTSEPSREPYVPQRERALEIALAQRPEYQRILAEIAAQKIDVRRTRNESRIQLDVVGRWDQYGLDRGFSDSIDSFGTGRFYDWSFGIELSIPIGNRAARERARTERDRLRRLDVERRRLEREVMVEIDRSIRALASLHQKVDYLKKRAGYQDTLRQQEREKLKLGRSTPIEIARLDDDWVESARDALEAELAFETAKAEYLRIIGTLLQERLPGWSVAGSASEIRAGRWRSEMEPPTRFGGDAR